MRKAIVLIAASLLFASCSFYTSVTDNISDNPFASSFQLSAPLGDDNLFQPQPDDPDEEGDGTDGDVTTPPETTEPQSDETGAFTFVLFTDPHINRTDSGVQDHREEFLKFLEAESDVYPFIVCLGDLVDDGDIYSREAQDFIEQSRSYTTLNNFIYVIGNHDIRTHSRTEWDEEFKVLTPGHDNPRMMRYSYKGVSIYKLDNASRIFGKDQLNMLEEALRSDPNEYRIFLAHEVVATGGALDQTTVIFGSEAGELLRLFRLMRNYDVSMLFTGHHHKGNEIYSGDGFSEFNAAALHSRSGSFESDGYWYTVTVDPDAGEITVTSYLVTDDSAEPWRITGTDIFPLKTADETGEEEPPVTPPADDTEDGGNEDPGAGDPDPSGDAGDESV